MNNIGKAALSAGAAAALLLGGAGSLAFWNDAQDVDAGSISTGHLNLLTVAADTGTWTDVTNGGSAAISDIAAFNLVPGDTVAFTRTFEIDAEGDNLVADISTNFASLTAAAGDLEPYIDATVSAVVDGTSTTQITDANDGDLVEVSIEVAFDPATPGKIGNSGVNAGDDDSVDLSALEVILTQIQGSAGGN